MNPDLLAATYANQDAALALGLPNFTDYRKNWERQDFVCLPRLEARGRTGARYRIGQIYEYALMNELQRVVSRAVASEAIYAAFTQMRRSAHERVNLLTPEDRQAVWEGGNFAEKNDPNGFGGFVDFPGIYFDPDFLIRDTDNPLFWAFDAVEGHYRNSQLDGSLLRNRTLLKATGRTALAEAFESIRDEDLKIYAHPDDAPRWSAYIVINVTDALIRVDKALEVRVRARQLSGLRGPPHD